MFQMHLVLVGSIVIFIEIISIYELIEDLNQFVTCEYEEPIVSAEQENDDVIMYLAGKQNINGSWSYDEKIFEKIGVEIQKLKNNKPRSLYFYYISIIECDYIYYRQFDTFQCVFSDSILSIIINIIVLARLF